MKNDTRRMWDFLQAEFVLWWDEAPGGWFMSATFPKGKDGAGYIPQPYHMCKRGGLYHYAKPHGVNWRCPKCKALLRADTPYGRVLS